MSNSSPGLKDKRKYSKPSYKLISVDQVLGKSTLLSHVISHIWQGKSLERAFMHYGLQHYHLKGSIIDYGSGSDKPRYHDFFKQKLKEVTLTDYYMEADSILKLDLEKPFRLDQKYQSFICVNVLEHIFNSQQLLKNMSRYLKKNGVGIISTPFIFQYHPSPFDYWRYTPEAIENMTKKTNMKLTEVIYLGSGPSISALSQIWFVITPRVIRVIGFIVAWYLDKLLLRFSKIFHTRYGLGYIFKLEKQ